MSACRDPHPVGLRHTGPGRLSEHGQVDMLMEGVARRITRTAPCVSAGDVLDGGTRRDQVMGVVREGQACHRQGQETTERNKTKARRMVGFLLRIGDA